jgi:ABC-type uncharacterized transport system YnjBCD ATPase subunit
VPESAIVTRGLSRSFREVRAVDDLTLEVPRGVAFGFLGPNGSGKTTTIRLLLGHLAPSVGSAEVLGLDPVREGAQLRARCGALLEFPGLYVGGLLLFSLDSLAGLRSSLLGWAARNDAPTVVAAGGGVLVAIGIALLLGCRAAFQRQKLLLDGP